MIKRVSGPAFDERILQLRGQGLTTAQIAARLGVSSAHVRSRLKTHGVELSRAGFCRDRISPIWEMDDDQRRAAIARREADGARMTRMGASE